MAKSLVSFEADAAIDDIAEALIRDGGVILLNLLPPALMDDVYDEILGNSAEHERAAGGDILWPAGNKTIGGLAGISPTYVERLVLHPKMLQVADAILKPHEPMSPTADAPEADAVWPYTSFRQLEVVDDGHGGSQLIAHGTGDEGPYCHHYTLGATVMLEVGRGAKNQCLHRETAIYQPWVAHLPGIREFDLSVNWAGSDFRADNGATRVVPGSNHWPEDRIAQPDEVTSAEMPKGSAVAWLSRTLHGAGASEAEDGRRAFFASYIADWARQEENQYIAVPPEVAAKLSNEGQRIIGYRSGPSLGWVKGRDQENLLRDGRSSPL
ncbi:MAG: phytanoyl-CoA dioxygenase family protein [Pseudomonadota bacterium]